MNYLSFGYLKDKWAQAGFKKYFQSTGLLLFSRVICMAISFLTTAYIARNLGPGNFGQLSYAVSFVSLFAFISSLGIDSILYRELITSPEKRNKLLGSGLLIKLGAGFIAAITASTVAFVFSTDDVSRILILILSGTFVFGAFQIIVHDFQARVESVYPAVIPIIVLLILNTLKIAVIISGKGVIYLALVLLLESILYAAFYVLAYRLRLHGRISMWRWDSTIARSLLLDSWPLIFSSAFALIYSRIDQIFIKHMMGAASVGIYDSAVRIAEVWYFIPSIIVSALYPAIINAKKQSEELYTARLTKLAILLFLLAVFIAASVSMAAPYIINALYGPEYMGGVIILQLYVWACVGVFLTMLATNYLITENYKHILFQISLLPMVANVLLNLLWIPTHGIAGAALATLVSYTLGLLPLFFFKETRAKLLDMYRVFRKHPQQTLT